MPKLEINRKIPPRVPVFTRGKFRKLDDIYYINNLGNPPSYVVLDTDTLTIHLVGLIPDLPQTEVPLGTAIVKSGT